MTTNPPRSIDDYIVGFPPAVREALEILRGTIQEAAPGATEAIKYGMPCFVLHGNLVYFAAFKRHIGLYSVPVDEPEFRAELVPYVQGKGSVQFPLNQPLPLDLITRLITFRVKAHRQKAKNRADKGDILA